MSDYLDSLYSGLNDESLEAITASIGFNDGANKGFWRKQPRKKWGKGKGQWIEMGARLRALFKINGELKSVTGRSAGSDGTPNGVRFLPDAGQPGVDSNKIYGVDTAHLEEIQATLPDNYVESKGLNANREQTGTGSVVSTANIPEISDMETADVTPDDIRMVEEGVNSAEGREAEGFKNTDEGKAVAQLDDVTESDVVTGKDVNALVDGGPNSDIPNLSDAELTKIIEEGVDFNKPGSYERERAAQDEWMARRYGDKRDPNRKPASEMTDEELQAAYDGAFSGGPAGQVHSAAERKEIFDEHKARLEGASKSTTLAPTNLPEGFTENPDGSLTQTMPNGAKIEVSSDGSGWTIMNSDGRYSGAFSAGQPGNRAASAQEALDAFNEKPESFVASEEKAKALGFPDGWTVSGDKYNAAYKTDNPDGSMADIIIQPEYSADPYTDELDLDKDGNPIVEGYRVTRPDSRWDSAKYEEDQKVYATREEALARAVEIANNPEAPQVDTTPEDAADAQMQDLIRNAMKGNKVDLGQWLEAKDKGDDFGDGIDSGDEDGDGIPDESDPDFDGSEDDLGFESTTGEQDPELLRDIVRKDRDEAENINLGDVIMGPDGMPVRVKKYEWDESDYDEESPGMTITATDANGEEVEFYKGRYDSVYYPEFAPEGAAPVAKPQSVKPATPATPAEPVKPTRIAPDSASEMDASAVQIGDKLYSNDGSVLLGEVTQVRKKNGKTEARLSLDGKDEGFQELGPKNLVDRNPDVASKKQAEKDAKKAEAARVKAEKKVADEKAAADKAAAANDPRTDEGIENLKNILEGADNPERLQAAIDVLNDSSLSNDEKAAALVDALTTKLGFLNGTDEQRLNARKAEQKAMSLLEKAGIPGSSLDERKAAAAKRQSRSNVLGDSKLKFPESKTLAGEVADMKKRLDAGEDVPIEETDALNAKIAAHRDRFWMKGDHTGKPLPGESQRVDDEIRKAQREGTAPIPVVRNDGTEIRPDDSTAAPESTTATPAGVTPTPPKLPKPVKKQPKPKPIGTADDDGKPINGGNKTPEEVAKMRERKLQNAVDEDGNPIYATDLEGNVLTDKKGRPIPVQDTDAILAALRADYPDAKIDDKGNIVVHREEYTGSDGKQKRFELLVHKNSNGKIGVSMKFTDVETGETEQLFHHDERDSYMGLHGKTNGIQALIDITRGGSPEHERRTATRGYSTEGKTDFRERAEYFVRQGRLLTHEQVWAKYLDGNAEEINTSKGGRGVNRGKAYLTLRKREVKSAAEALREGDRHAFFQRVRAAAGHTPVTNEGRAALRKSIRDYLAKEMPELTPRERTVLAQYVDRSMQGRLVDPLARDIPHGSIDGTPLKPGMWIERENNIGQWARGQVEELQTPQLNAAGTEYNDNVVVRFADGSVGQLASQKMRISKDQKSPATKFIPDLTGDALRQHRKEQLAATAARSTGVLRFLDDVRAERAEVEEAANKNGGKIEDLADGDTLFSKEGEPLGPIIEKIPIVGKSGNPGYAVIYENADGEEVQVRLPMGEFRGPKA